MNVIDGKGKWVVEDNVRILPKGNESEEYLLQNETERQMQEEQELLNSLIPSEKEILMAEIELNTINLLLELEVM